MCIIHAENTHPALFVLCRKMPCSGQRRHQSRRHQQSRPAAPPPRLPAATPLQQAHLWPLSALLRQLSRRAATPLRRPLLPAETMMVTLHHTVTSPFYQAAISFFFKFPNNKRSLKQNCWGCYCILSTVYVDTSLYQSSDCDDAAHEPIRWLWRHCSVEEVKLKSQIYNAQHYNWNKYLYISFYMTHLFTLRLTLMDRNCTNRPSMKSVLHLFFFHFWITW